MSFLIIRSIEIQDTEVFIASTSNNVYPREYHRHEAKPLSEAYQTNGLGEVLKMLAILESTGEIRLTGSDPYSKNVREGYRRLPVELQHFLDTDHIGNFVRDYALARIEGKRFDAKKRINALSALRSDPHAVLDICKTRTEAFTYASPEIQSKRDVAKAYIQQCGDRIMFQYPVQFTGDRELAFLALQKNGCVYKDLAVSLKEDKELTRFAFKTAVDRRFHAHISSLLPDVLIRDFPFMRELIELCPEMHISGTPEILEDRDCALTWVKLGKWAVSEQRLLPQRYADDPEFKSILQERFQNLKSA